MELLAFYFAAFLLGFVVRRVRDAWWPTSRIRRWLLDPKRVLPQEKDPYYNREYAQPLITKESREEKR